MLAPRVVAIAYFSGRKGGTGKSTLAANQAIALSMALKTNVVLMDFGIDSTQTSSRLLGINPDRPGALDYMLGSVKDVGQVLVRSNVVPSVFVIPPGSLRSWDLWGSGVNVNQAFNALRNLIITASRITNAQVVLIDLPASIDDVVVIPALINANIINLVMDYANYADIVLAELDNSIVRPMMDKLKLNPIVNVVLNKWLPGLDAVEARARAFAHNGEVFILPTSPIVQYLTSTLKPFVLYEPRGSLERFVREFNNMTKALAEQVRRLLGF
ncbi:MAG: ParA family protein [Vulcanisaeta sp.]|nr:ParA family protein [Vulcanisaeta sp.]MCG2891958.1 ParA family protein [Vulcanisaeta sp.]